jgi:tartrate dehydratase alpha subunit/fumarate hydratase class I-like protein
VNREGGKAVRGRSQDTGLAVLVWSRKCGINFSVKEKDEASLSNGFRQDSLDAFILRFAGV